MARARILVVEDEAIVALDLVETLQELGYEVAGIASTAAEAVHQALSTSPDAVLMDIRLRDHSDGIDAACEIQRTASIPVIFLTAFADDFTLERAKSAAPYGYLVKPLVERELHGTLQMALHRREMEREARETSTLVRMLDDLGGGHYVLDRHWQFAEVSPGAEALLGSEQKDLLGRCIWDLYPELEDSVLGDVFYQVANGGGEMALEAYHLPAGIRVRLQANATDQGIAVFFVAQTAE